MQSGLTFLVDAPLSGGPMGRMMRGEHPGGGFFLGGLFGGLMTAAWAALIVLLVLWAVRNWSSPKNPITGFARRAASAIQTSNVPPITQTPLEILQTRYAKGEIDREAYQAIHSDLTGEAPPAAVPPTEASPV